MAKSRAEIHQLLVDLEHSVPAMIERYPDDREFMPVFVREADIITGQAAPEDHSWIHGQIGCILEQHGKLHEAYPPPSDLSPK